MRQPILAFACTFFATFVLAQTGEFPRNHSTVDVGPAIPAGSAADYLSTAPLLSAGSGYSFTRFLRSNVGVEIALGGADDQNAAHTSFGPVQGGDYYMIPFARRYVMPSPLTRIGFSAGGGGAYLHYATTVSSAGYYSSECYTCLSRGGWGSDGPGNAGWSFGHSRKFHVGSTFEFVAPSTDGQTVGYVQAARATDGWSNPYLEIGLRF